MFYFFLLFDRNAEQQSVLKEEGAQSDSFLIPFPQFHQLFKIFKISILIYFLFIILIY